MAEGKDKSPSVFVTDSLKRDLAVQMQIGWRRYTELFGIEPHGTMPQLLAMINLMHLDQLVDGIANHAVCKWYADGNGATAPEMEPQ